MKTLLATALSIFLAVAGTASAQTCSLPNTLTNGTTADATQVMANFDALLNCANGNGSVGSGTSGQIGYYAATGNALSGESLSNLLDSVAGSTQGSILYRSASGWVALPPGANGYVLQSGGASGDPSWAPPGGGGGGISTIVGAGVSSSAATVALPGMPVITRPTLASLSWLSQESATATDNTNGPLVLQTTQSTSGNSLNALIKNVAGSDWTVTVEYALGNHTGGSSLDLAGLIVYNSASGRAYVCGINGSSSIGVWAYNSLTSLNSGPASMTILLNPGAIWTRAQYVSSTATLTFFYSTDGFTWQTIYSTSASFVGVPTGYGITVGSQNNTSGYVLSLDYMVDSSP